MGVDGEALVMHAGDKPYVVAPSGQIELASRGLTLEAVNGIVSQLLPADALRALEEFGAIQQELAAQPEFPGESFTVVAARGGDDVWVEIRRRKISDDDRVPDEFFAPAPAPGADVRLAAPVAAPLNTPSTWPSFIPTTRRTSTTTMWVVGRRRDGARRPEDDGDAIPIDLDDLAIPDAAQLFGAPGSGRG